MPLNVDVNSIMNALILAGVLWIASSVSGLRERVARIEGHLQLNHKEEK